MPSRPPLPAQTIFLAKPFSYFDAAGECLCPSPDDVSERASRRVRTALVLDANVCLNLSNYARDAADDRVETMCRQFLLTVEFTKVDVIPFFGCMELASKRNRSELDENKLSGITSNVARALKQSEASLASGGKLFWRNEDSKQYEDETLGPMLEMLRFFYACFLKITEIRMRGSLKDRVVKNSMEFIDWCESLECHVALVSQAAFALFGGAQEADKLLRLGGEKTPLDAAWGAAWDIWHAWASQSYLNSLNVEGWAQHTIFVTEDSAAAFIAGQCVPRAVFLEEGKPILSTNSTSFDFPYFRGKHQQLLEQWGERKMRQLARLTNLATLRQKMDDMHLQDVVAGLETSVMDAWEQ